LFFGAPLLYLFVITLSEEIEVVITAIIHRTDNIHK
jgi:hypothetical protein